MYIYIEASHVQNELGSDFFHQLDTHLLSTSERGTTSQTENKSPRYIAHATNTFLNSEWDGGGRLTRHETADDYP